MKPNLSHLYEPPIFEMGDKCYGLLSSNNLPFMFLLVKVEIVDVEYDKNNPEYECKILKFYNNIRELRFYLTNAFLQRGVGCLHKRAYKWILDPYDYNTTKEFEKAVINDDSHSNVVIPGLHLFQFKKQALTAINKISDFGIETLINQLEAMVLNSHYDGTFNIKTATEWDAMIKHFFPDYEPIKT